ASHAAPDWYDREGAAITRLVDDLVTAAGGSISAEHGIGQMKLAEFERLAPPGRNAALRSIKHALDPHGLMNPGKLVRQGSLATSGSGWASRSASAAARTAMKTVSSPAMVPATSGSLAWSIA